MNKLQENTVPVTGGRGGSEDHVKQKAMRHAGLYVQDIERLETFYRQVFDMIPICSQQPDRGPLLDELLGIRDVEIMTTKLVTEYGKRNGQGDMLELVKVLTAGPELPRLPDRHPISMIGMGHVAFGVVDIKAVVEKLKEAQGTQGTKIYEMPNKNLCCFCRDPEGNWLELIQRVPHKEEIMSEKLQGKTVLITGGTSGIGGGCSLLFAREKARVIALARGEERGRNFETAARAEGLDVKYYPCDVSVREQVQNVHEQIRQEYGGIDILMNNAGMLHTAALEEITDEDWDAMYQANVKSALYMCQEFIGELKERHGVILNNASINGLHAYIKGKKSYMYATAKAALIQFTQYLAKNYAPEVRANCLCPGITVTNLFTNRDFSRFDGCNLLGRMAEPEEIAKVALFLVSDDASFMTGSIVVADGGETLKGA